MDGIDTSGAASRAASSATAANVVKPVTPATAAAAAAAQAASPNLISLLADAAPPIDSRKVEAIRSLIAQGRYPIDESAIAAKMVALDVPVRGA